MSKIDLQLESGEYFLKPHEKKKNELAAKKQAQAEHAVKRDQEREKMFIAPKEPIPGEKPKKRKHSKDEDTNAKAEKKAQKKDGKSKKRKHDEA